MTPRREWFHEYELFLRGSKYLDDDHALEISGIGIIKIKIIDDIVHNIKELLDVKALKKNILSLG